MSHGGTADAPPATGSAEDPGQRGRLTIAPRVVERVAQHAVGEVSSATGSAPTVLGISVGTRTRAQVSATVHDDAADVTVQMSVRWPASVRDVTEQVRSRIVTRLHDLVGIQFAHVSIRVTGLVVNTPEQRVR